MDAERQLNNRRAKIPRDNLLSAETKAYKKLQEQKDIIIKPGDQGSAAVMLSKQDYINEANRQLNHRTYYQQLAVDPTPQHTTEVTKFVSSMFIRGLINKKTISNTTPSLSGKVLPSSKDS